MVTEQEVFAGLRTCTWQLRRAHRGGRFPMRAHVGCPSGAYFSWVDDVDSAHRSRLDRGLCHEISAALLSRARHAGVPLSGAWLTRPGPMEARDEDLLWCEPMRSVFLEAGLEPIVIAVVTRFGWYDPFQDRGATWKRLRIR